MMKYLKTVVTIVLCCLWAAGPASADSKSDNDPLNAQISVEGNNITVKWNKVEGVDGYHVVWEQEKGPFLRRTGTTGRLIPEDNHREFTTDGGEIISVCVYAVKNGLNQLIKSHVKAVVPKGAVLGSGKVTMEWAANYGITKESATGTVAFKIYESSPTKDYTPPSDSAVTDVVFHWQVYGVGNVFWENVTNTTDCWLHSAATGRFVAQGQLRSSPDCKLDVEVYEMWSPAENTGQCAGKNPDPYGVMYGYTSDLMNVPLVEGHTINQRHGSGQSATYTFTDLEVDVKTGCVVGGK